MKKMVDLKLLAKLRGRKKDLYSGLSSVRKVEMCSITQTRPKKDALECISCYLPVNLKVEQISTLKGGGLRTP